MDIGKFIFSIKVQLNTVLTNIIHEERLNIPIGVKDHIVVSSLKVERYLIKRHFLHIYFI